VINNQAQEHPFPAESLILALLLSQHKLIDHLKSMIKFKQTDNRLIHLGKQKKMYEFEDSEL
jgi:hypothetical protein